jgi:hypothetical protein
MRPFPINTVTTEYTLFQNPKLEYTQDISWCSIIISNVNDLYVTKKHKINSLVFWRLNVLHIMNGTYKRKTEFLFILVRKKFKRAKPETHWSWKNVGLRPPSGPAEVGSFDEEWSSFSNHQNTKLIQIGFIWKAAAKFHQENLRPTFFGRVVQTLLRFEAFWRIP